MESLFDLESWRVMFAAVFGPLVETFVRFVPNLVGALLILAVGWLLARVVEVIAARGLRTVGLDRASTRVQLNDLLERAEIDLTLSQIVAKLAFWLVLLTFAVSAVDTLQLKAVTETMDRLVGFIPRVIGAALLGVFGLLLARFAATLVASGAAAAGFTSAARLGFLAQLLIGGLVVVVAIEQLGVATSVLVVPFAVVLGAGGFAIGLAFALGAHPVITHILAGHFLKQTLPRDLVIQVGNQRGLVERVGAVDTLLRDGEHTWSIPNGRLLDQVVTR